MSAHLVYSLSSPRYCGCPGAAVSLIETVQKLLNGKYSHIFQWRICSEGLRPMIRFIARLLTYLTSVLPKPRPYIHRITVVVWRPGVLLQTSLSCFFSAASHQNVAFDWADEVREIDWLFRTAGLAKYLAFLFV